MAKKTYVLDTSACLSDSDCIYSYSNNDIVIPLKVLEEIDKHKKRQDGVGVNARTIIRTLDELRRKGTLQKGVRIAKGKGILKVRGTEVAAHPDLNSSTPDHVIISTALAESTENGSRKTILVSRDINMRVICDSLGLLSEDYTENQIIKKDSDLFSGFSEILVDDQTIDHFYDNESIYLDKEEFPGLCTNQFLMMVSNSNEKKTALCRFIDYKEQLWKVSDFKNGLWGVKPKNKEQAFALDLLLDPEVQVISLVGKAGSGKTLLAIAAGLEQVMPNYSLNKLVSKKQVNDGVYKKLVVARPVMPMGKDIGFLPGSLQEKMLPWLMPIQDNLQHLLGNNKSALEMYIESGKIEIEALTYIRGRSISNAYIIIDEAQNLTKHEIKTIITRIGEGTKIVLTGDIEQIDSVYVNETTNGLAHALENFKQYPVAGHVTFKRGERSEVATLASKVL